MQLVFLMVQMGQSLQEPRGLPCRHGLLGQLAQRRSPHTDDLCRRYRWDQLGTEGLIPFILQRKEFFLYLRPCHFIIPRYLIA